MEHISWVAAVCESHLPASLTAPCIGLLPVSCQLPALLLLTGPLPPVVLMLTADEPTYNSTWGSQHRVVCWDLHAPEAAECGQHMGGGRGRRYPATHGLGSSSWRAGAGGLGAGSSALLLAGRWLPWLGLAAALLKAVSVVS